MWMLLETLQELFEHLGALLLLGLLAAAGAYHLRLKRHLLALQHRVAMLEQREGRAASAGAQMPPTPAPPIPGPPTSAPVPQPGAVPPRPGSAATPPPSAMPTSADDAAAAALAEPLHPPAAGWLAGVLGGGNWLVRGGVLLLFLGVGFLLKFAADNAVLPVPLRLLGVSLGGLALIAVGLRQMARRRVYALTLQGAGVGLIYLTLYAAFRLYGLLPAGTAFALMLGVVVAAGWLALRHDAMLLAVLGTLGGLAAPVLASTGSGSHVMLFGYYAVLNAGVLWLSLRRAWRPLHLVGFACTFGVSVLWGARFYRPEFFSSVEPFLVLFFAMYLAIAVAYALLRDLRLRDPMDATLVFGTPLMSFALQSQLLADSEYALALSALVMALVYAGCAVLLQRLRRTGLALLVDAFVALAVGFATVAVALAFDARWTSASWALEGAALVWVGWRQRRLLARLAGAALQALAGAAWLLHLLEAGAWRSGEWLGTVMLALAGLASGAMLARPAPTARDDGRPGDDTWAKAAHAGPQRGDRSAAALSVLLAAWGVAWWLVGGSAELVHQVSDAATPGALLLFFAASAAALYGLGWRLRWPLARLVAVGLPAALLLLAALSAVHAVLLAPASAGLLAALRLTHPLTDLAALGWPLALLSAAALLWLEDERAPQVRDALHAARDARWSAAMHVLGAWLLAGLAGWEVGHLLQRWLPEVASWQRLGGLLPLAGLVAAVAVAVLRLPQGGPGAGWMTGWPLRGRERLYLLPATAPMLAVAAMGAMAVSAADPTAPWPIPYLPLLNPIDVVVLTVLAGGVLWMWACKRRGLAVVDDVAVAAVGVGFVCLNAALLRSVHMWTAVPWRVDALFDSTLVQASLSLLWGVTGLLTMLGASRAASRAAWLTGAGLMGVVVAKLMLVDLASTGTVARIVSFISVGLLMMLVGYLAPVPPRDDEGERGGTAAGGGA
jgi:uncharacterized membrane protein